MERSEKAKQLRALRKYGKKVGRKRSGVGMGPSVFVGRLLGLRWFRAPCVFHRVFTVSQWHGC